MNIFLTVFFLLLSITGIVFQNETGVFVGLCLFPWQIIKLLKGRLISLIIIIISSIIGILFFVLMKEWLILLFFLFIQLYNYWAYLNINKIKEE